MPERIQLSRKKGWRMPENTMKVDRSTKWGNPYVIGEGCTHEQAVERHRDALTQGKIVGRTREELDVVMLYSIGVQMEIGQLRGKNLACWCALDQPCHADVLLELANAPTDARKEAP